VGINDMSGGGVKGIFAGGAGKTGVGVLGETGAYGGWGTAGKFISYNSNDVTPTVHIVNNGSQVALNIESNNASNVTPALMINHAGVGSLASFKKSGVEKVSISNAGNITTSGNITASGNIAASGNVTTSGTVTVKNNNGIVRNTGAAQQRVEVLTVSIPAFNYQHYDTNFGAPAQIISVNFSTAFSSPPAVYIANAVTGSLMGLMKQISGVTTTGFTFTIANFGPYDLNSGAGSYKVVAMGNE
jgi:hypothetical protein